MRTIEEVPASGSDPQHPYSAFELGRVRLIPVFGGDAHKADQVEFFYQVYDLRLNPLTGKADAVAVMSILKDGKTPVAKAPANPIETEFAGSSVVHDYLLFSVAGRRRPLPGRARRSVACAR